jgi:hypothetical protein
MLSELTEKVLELSRFKRNQSYFKRFIESGPKISMGNYFHSQQGHEIRKGPIIGLRIINGKSIFFSKAIQKPRYKTKGDFENVEAVSQYHPTFA